MGAPERRAKRTHKKKTRNQRLLVCPGPFAFIPPRAGSFQCGKSIDLLLRNGCEMNGRVRLALFHPRFFPTRTVASIHFWPHKLDEKWLGRGNKSQPWTRRETPRNRSAQKYRRWISTASSSTPAPTKRPEGTPPSIPRHSTSATDHPTSDRTSRVQHSDFVVVSCRWTSRTEEK